MRSSKTLLNNIIISLISLLIIFLSVKYYLAIDSIDESFTISLVKHSFLNIVEIDSFDVHPPLYYLLLKVFLNLTTFWTQGIEYKIISARLFSVGCLLLSAFIGCKTLNKMHLKYNSMLLFVTLVVISFLCGEINSIRMYPLSTLFVSLEVLNITSYIYNRNIKYIIFSTIFAILSSYTHDFSAVISGLFILSVLFYVFLKHNNDLLDWIFAGVVFIISYIPWIFIAISQIVNIPSVHWISGFTDMKDSCEFLLIIIIFSFPIILFKNHINERNFKIFELILYISLTMLIAEIILSILMQRPIFELRYVYSLIFIFTYVSFGIINNLNHNENTLYLFKRIIYFIDIILLIILLLLGIRMTHKIISSDIQNYKSANVFMRKYIYPYKDKRLIKHINVSKITNNYKSSNRLFMFNTFAQYNNKILPNSDNYLITKSLAANKANQGNHPNLRFMVWHTRTIRK